MTYRALIVQYVIMNNSEYSNIPTPILLIILVIAFIISLLFIIASWNIFKKAGKPGWIIFIPIYNQIVMLQIVGRPVWWFILQFIPVVNIIISLILTLDLAKAFGKSAVFAILGLWFTPIGILILGFGKDKYIGIGDLPTNNSNTNTTAPTMPTAAASTNLTTEQTSNPPTVS